MGIDQPRLSFKAILITRPLALCRRVREVIFRHARMILQRALSHKPRLEPTRLPVLGAKLRPQITPRPALGARVQSIPFSVHQRVLQLVKPGHAEFGNAPQGSRVVAASGPHPSCQPQPETASGETDAAPNADKKR